MNRWDEIQACARDIATNIHTDPEKITAMADDLIKLCGLMISATGKGVAIAGETAMYEDEDGDPGAATICQAGEDMQRAVQTVVDESSSARCDLERWKKPDHTGYVGVEDGWTYADRRPDVLRGRNDDPTGETGVSAGCRECGRRDGHKLHCATGRKLAATKCSLCDSVLYFGHFPGCPEGGDH